MTDPAPVSSESCLAIYGQALRAGSKHSARTALLHALSQAPEQTWLDSGRALVLRREPDAAREVFGRAVKLYPASGPLCVGLAGLQWQTGRHAEAEKLLRDLLSHHATDISASFLLARLLFDQGRAQAAATVVRELFASAPQDVETAIRAVEMLDDFGRAQDAMKICEVALTAEPDEPRLHAYAGMLGIQLGRFQATRAHYEFALAHAAAAVEWNIPIGLSSLQRYTDAAHPDFAFFHNVLQQPGLSDVARATTLFALGKACDDISEYALAAGFFREGNACARANRPWSRKQWNRMIGARSAAAPYPWSMPAPADWAPLFIVGVPRSGTTLLAELIGRHRQVCNRGELGWLQGQVQRLADAPREQSEPFQQAAVRYAAHLRQDDSSASWFIDKQPLNLLHIDLIMACWPNARIIHCQRNPRDVALSLWSQSFHDSAHNYACDFADIAAVLRGCDRVMAHWKTHYSASIFTVRYEELVLQPDAEVHRISHWLGLSGLDLPKPPEAEGHAIRTASAWQARQPIHTRSIDHWKHYAPHVPELLKFPPT
ncbi:MAG: sulfotransferase [Rhodanobacter sp.]